jgi:hypothetical protein
MAKTKARAAVGKRPSRYQRERAADRRTPTNVDAVARGGRPDWRWRTFPVFVAFVVGMLVAFVVNGTTQNPAAFVLAILAILGCVYAAIHLFVMNVIVAGRVRRRARALARGETPEEDMEEVVVYEENR